MGKIKRFLNDEEGSIAIEYVILAGCIGMVIVAGAIILGNNIDTKLNEIGTEIGTLTVPTLP
jgi:Flp pilus assembly pilin Flp